MKKILIFGGIMGWMAAGVGAITERELLLGIMMIIVSIWMMILTLVHYSRTYDEN